MPQIWCYSTRDAGQNSEITKSPAPGRVARLHRQLPSHPVRSQELVIRWFRLRSEPFRNRGSSSCPRYSTTRKAAVAKRAPLPRTAKTENRVSSARRGFQHLSPYERPFHCTASLVSSYHTHIREQRR